MEHSKILNFIRKQKLMILSTVSAESTPESATMEFAVVNNFEVVFQTFKHYRKYANLLAHKKVSIVFGWNDNMTVQFEGDAQLLSGELLDSYRDYYLRKVPSARKFSEMKGATLFRIHPKWARYTDLSKKPTEVFEVNLASSYVIPKNLQELKKLGVVHDDDISS